MTVIVAGTMIPTGCGGPMVTLAEAVPNPGVLAVMVTGPPCATPVTTTVALVAPPAMETVAGTVARLVLLELSVAVRPPAGAAEERLRLRFPVAFWLTVSPVAGKSALVPGAATCT